MTPQQEKKIAWALLPILVCALAGMGYLYLKPQPQLDPITGCPEDPAAITAVNVILVDATEKLNQVQREDIRQAFTGLLRNAGPGEQFILYDIVSRKKLQLVPRLVSCTLPDSGSPLETLVGGRDVFAQQRSSEMEERFQDTLDAILDTEGEEDSPIMERIQAAAVVNFKNSPAGSTRRLFIVSDMMQHSTEFSQYRGAVDADRFFKSGFFRKTAVPLDGVDVEIFYIAGAGGVRRLDSHLAFWKNYFNRLHARSFRTVTIDGAGWQQNS
jgi:hypothetical protein